MKEYLNKSMRILFLLLFLYIPSFSFAQFSDDYNYYLYIPRGETAESCGNNIYYVHFNDDERLYCATITRSTLKTKYQNDVIDEYAVNKTHNYNYDSDMSTYKYEVYYSKKTRARTSPPYCDIYGNWLPGIPDGYHYRAFSSDRSEMIIWHTNQNDDTPRGKRYFKLIKIEDLIPPKNTNDYNFLR